MPETSFLRRLLPDTGLICVAMALPKGGFRHFFCESLEQAEQQITWLENSEQTVFLAQATFETNKNRKQSNTLQVRNFFLDIDCGEEKDYPNQLEAVRALKKFVADTGLPMPSIVISGNGLYAHWLLDEAIPAQQWQGMARILKDTTKAYEFRVDQSRTSDLSSVLRPVGATHRKDPTNPKKVRLLLDSPATPPNEFKDLLTKAARKKRVSTEQVKPPKAPKDLNAEFCSGLEDGVQSDPNVVADKCAQIGYFRSQKGNVSEPEWYAALGVVIHCADGDAVTQEWSSGHPDYTSRATADKIQQYRDTGFGPSTCAKLGELCSDRCIGCRHKGNIKSPIVLGRPEVAKLPELIEQEDPTPEGFKRTPVGVQALREEQWFTFYQHDLHIEQLAFDESLGYQVAVVKHTLPHEGTMSFQLRSSLIHDPRGLLVALSDNHVHVVGVAEAKAMVAYMASYISKLQQMQKMTRLFTQMGWKGTDEFVLGKRVFRSDGTSVDAGLAQHVPTAAQGFHSAGDLKVWSEATRLLDGPGMEPFAFALLCGFGAPLLKFTGFDGAMVSMFGGSGAGKTLLMRWVQSIYGFHNDLLMLRDDTRNALVSRLGVYGNLPLAIDEITNIDGQELSDLVYRITQGRDKARLTKNSEEKKGTNRWNTLALTTTNSSLTDKLSGAKYDASAEINRLFEYHVPNVKAFSGDVTSDLFWVIHQNYGLAGERYIQWAVQHTDEIKTGLAKVQMRIDEAAGVRGEERFWSAVASTAVYGGVIAKRLGIIDFDIAKVMHWVVLTIGGMRASRDDLAEDSVSILAQYLAEHAGNTLVVQKAGTGREGSIELNSPRGALRVRVEADNGRIFVARAHFKNWVSKRFGSYGRIKADLQENLSLLNPNKRKTLSAGTNLAGAQQPCWEIDGDSGALGTMKLRVVRDAQTAAVEANEEFG